MADREIFESIKVLEAEPRDFRETVAALRGKHLDLSLDPERGCSMVLGDRRWTFILTSNAASQWERLGKIPMTLGALANHHTGLDEPFVQWLLVAVPGKRRDILLEMRDSDWQLLWTGAATLRGDELEFSMPITRAYVDAKGIMAGSINANGRITVKESRLPRPITRREPTFVVED
jgi:hypothetical protein